MSPIYTRPIREQLEHDRVVRQLQARYKRKHDVAINPGPEQNQSVMVGDLAVYPDLVLFSLQRGRRLEGTVEVETAESVHPLEARAEWGVYSRLKAPFHLYVPPQSVEAARRICDEQQFAVSEIWTYHTGLDQQVRFTQVYRSPHAPRQSAAPSRPATVKTRPTPPAKAKAAAKPKPAVKAPKKAAKRPVAAKSGGRTAKAAKGASTGRATARPAAKRAPAKKRR